MRIWINECRKLMNVKLVLILVVFTGLYYFMFVSIPFYYNYTDSQETQELYPQLYQKFGTVLSKEEREHGLKDMKKDMKQKLNEAIQNNEVLGRAKIKSYKDLREYREAVYEKEESGKKISELEQSVAEEEERLMESGSQTMKWIMWIQEIERIYEFEAENPDDISVLSESLVITMGADIPRLGVLCMICCMVLIIPYYIRERLCRVIPLFVSTRYGRRQFVMQTIAVLSVSTLVCLLQFLLYTVLNAAKGHMMFWDCPANTLSQKLWYDISFGQWYLLAFFFLWLLVLAAALLAHIISRISFNYIIGIALAIPLAVAGARGADMILAQLFNVYVSKWMPWTAVFFFGVTTVLMCLYLKRDKRRDVV